MHITGYRPLQRPPVQPRFKALGATMDKQLTVEEAFLVDTGNCIRDCFKQKARRLGKPISFEKAAQYYSITRRWTVFVADVSSVVLTVPPDQMDKDALESFKALKDADMIRLLTPEETKGNYNIWLTEAGLKAYLRLSEQTHLFPSAFTAEN